MACHIRLASENAKMGLPEVSLGVIPGYGGTQRLAQLVGKGKAFEMITTGKMISAEQALEYKLVNYLEPQENLMSKCYKIANQIIKNSPKAISAALKSINAGFNSEMNGFEVEIDSFSNCFQSDEFIERVSKLIPMGRMAKRNEYRGAVQFLCSDASSYMNGQNLVIDGGRSAW